MAASSLFALIDDVASILDDVAVLAKVAVKKTTGVLGDDLALNAQQVAGVKADRELPVVWAVAKGSARNKLVLVPMALIISRFLPWLVTPLLMIGGAYLCYEGFEKVVHRFLHTRKEVSDHRAELMQANADRYTDLVAFEKEKIKGAIRTDFVLSAEIVTLSLGLVVSKPFITQLLVLTMISIIMTVGVYGAVALIVKLDDLGLVLLQNEGHMRFWKAKRWTGLAILASASGLMKTLSVAGTIAMFLVGGGILSHGVPMLHHVAVSGSQMAGTFPGIGRFLASMVAPVIDGLVGMLAGAVVVGLVSMGRWLLGKRVKGIAR